MIDYILWIKRDDYGSDWLKLARDTDRRKLIKEYAFRLAAGFEAVIIPANLEPDIRCTV